MQSLSCPFSFSRLGGLALAIGAGLLLSACGAKVVKETPAETRIEKPKPPTAVPMWLGNPARNFFGTGPMPKALKDGTVFQKRGRNSGLGMSSRQLSDLI